MFWRPDEIVSGRGQIPITVKGLYVGLWPSGMADGIALQKFQRAHPSISVNSWNAFRIPGDLDIASELMSFAAQAAPDITFTYIHRLQFYIDQGFFHRLNEFIGEDENNDGVLEPAEVRWKPWLDIPPLYREMGMRGTDIYALPASKVFFSVMVFRPDIFVAAGLDPRNFPKDFPEFLLAGQKICAVSLRNPNGRRIYAMSRSMDGFFQMLLYSGGGAPGVGDLYGPGGGLIGRIDPGENPGERIRSLGFKPSDVKVKWRAVFDDIPTKRALEAIWKLCWQPWILNPHTDEPLNLTQENIRQGELKCPKTGHRIILSTVPGGIQYGICRPGSTASMLGESDADLLREGELAMLSVQNNNAVALGKEIRRYGFALPPALEPGGKPVVIAIPQLFSLNSELKDEKLRAGWQFLSFFSGTEWRSIATRYLIEHGYVDSVSPLDAEQFGFHDAVAKMPENWVKVNREAMASARVSPYFSGFQQAETEFFSRVLHKITDDPRIDIPLILKDVQNDVDERILRPPGEGKGRGANLFAAVLLLCSAGLVGGGIWSVTRLPRDIKQSTSIALPPSRVKLVFWFLVLPAVASVLIWNYYPMVRGFLLAFQEYRLDGETKWVGLANFAEGAWSQRFWYTIWNSIKFIALNISIGFFAPIALAVLLHEIPRGKYLFRTVFFLPSVTSGLVIMLLWVGMYEPSEGAVFNQILRPVIEAWNSLVPSRFDVDLPIRWLQNPKLAMICVILPGVWAAMGAGCLIYLAALQSVSPDLYEAAEIDGAGFWKKLTHITLPYLRPLLIINLIGAFIGSAHGWSSIFVMTGGGPELSTQVAALEIWVNSFVFLRFGMATAQAWILGAMLMGFTVWQIKQMQKVEFRKAGTY